MATSDSAVMGNGVSHPVATPVATPVIACGPSPPSSDGVLPPPLAPSSTSSGDGLVTIVISNGESLELGAESSCMVCYEGHCLAGCHLMHEPAH